MGEDVYLKPAGVVEAYVRFAEFFPKYLEAHADERTKIVHTCGLLSGLAIGAVGIARREPGVLLAGLAMGYLPAFVSHWVFEKNQPKSFTHPVLSFRADFVMAWKFLRGERDAAPEGTAAARPAA
jgi:hypothetical protein